MIFLRTEKEIDALRRCNQIVALVLKELKEAVAPGVTTRELNERAEASPKVYGGEPAFKGYRGFPAKSRTAPRVLQPSTCATSGPTARWCW